MIIEPVVLEGRYVRLEPLSLDHHVQLNDVGLDEDLWRFYSIIEAEWPAVRARLAEKLDARSGKFPECTIGR